MLKRCAEMFDVEHFSASVGGRCKEFDIAERAKFSRGRCKPAVHCSANDELARQQMPRLAQSESNNSWRIEQTKSMRDEATRPGRQLVYTDATGSAAKQTADVNSILAQLVDLIFLRPREDKPLVSAVMKQKKADIPLDRGIVRRSNQTRIT